jgi:hypothetical protein
LKKYDLNSEFNPALTMVDSIKKMIYLKNYLHTSFDLLLENQAWIDSYKAVLNYFQYNYISRELDYSYKLSTLVAFRNLNTQKVTVNDIVYMRKNEELFDMWRTNLDAILTNYHNQEGQFNDNEAEFKYLVAEQKRLSECINKSEPLKKIFKSTASKIAIGGLSGGLTAAFSQDVIPSIIGGIIPPVFESLLILLNLQKDRVIRDHYLSISTDNE